MVVFAGFSHFIASLMRYVKGLFVVTCGAALLLQVTLPSFAHGGEDHGDAGTGQGADGEVLFQLEGGNEPQSSQLGFLEREGSVLPMETEFRDARGERVTLANLTKGGTRPLVLNMQYYNCPNLCGQILIDQAETFGKVSRTAGTDYQLVTVSIAPEETPELAAQIKKRTLSMLDAEFPPEGWSFLTGTKANIDKIAEAVGFHYRRSGEKYEHPLGLVFISPRGKITRYVHGLDYLPAVVNLSIMEASDGTVQPAVAKVIRLCFSYEPDGSSIAFRTKRVTGVVTVTFAGVFGFFLLRRSLIRRRKYRQEDNVKENG